MSSEEESVALVLDAGGARSAYQVGALEVLLPALAERGHRPTVLVGTSAGALICGGLAGVADRPAPAQAAALRDLLDQVTKPAVITPLWRQVPEVVARYASETLGLSRFRLRGLFGTDPLRQTLGSALDWEAVHRHLADGTL
ncbi:MAG: patatin-like phospholipase family protein, partial [Nocardioides sp.]|nr:patatin-like phospholipase family protein [Nocardioides sp.]